MTRAAALLSGMLITLTAIEASATEERKLALTDVVRIARTRAPEVRDALARAEQADAAVDASYSGYLPNAKADVAANRTWAHSYEVYGSGVYRSTPQVGIGTNASGDLAWTAWDFGRTSSAVGAAKADAVARSADWKATTNELVRRTAVLFLTVIYDEDLVRIADATVRLREKHASLTRALVDAGLRPPVDEARARVELSLAKLDRTRAEQELAQDRVRLATVLVRNPSEPMQLVRPRGLPKIGADARRAAEQALKNRPEVIVATASVDAETERAGIASARRLPSFGLALDATHQTNRPDGDRRFFPTGSVNANASVNVPIFDWRVWGNVPVARASVAAVEARASGLRIRVQGEAAEAAYALRAAATLLDRANEARELSNVALLVVEARYQAGRDGPLDLFQAAQKDAEARTATVRAELAVAVATVELLAATGRLHELSGVAAARTTPASSQDR